MITRTVSMIHSILGLYHPFSIGLTIFSYDINSK